MTEAKVSKRSQAVAIMKANAESPMATVVTLIAQAIDVSEANAKSYYRYIVEHKLAPGIVAKTTRAVKEKVAKAPKVSKAAKTPKVKAQKHVVDDAYVAQVEKIKAANLARMKEVTRRSKSLNTQLAEVESDIDTNDDSFAAPKFLSKSALAAIL